MKTWKSRCWIAAVLAACAVPSTLWGEPVTWNVDANGSWTVPSNWSGNALPTATSNVTIDRPAGDFLITLGSGTQTINSLYLGEQLTVGSSAILSVATTFQVNNLFTLDGTLRNATVSLGAGGQINVVSATLEGVTLNPDLTVTNDTLTISNGLTLNGGILRLIENAGTTVLTLSNSQTLGGTGTILFDGLTASGPSVAGSHTLTLGPGIAVRTGTDHGLLSPSGLVNQGLMSSQTASKTMTISAVSFTNSGTLQTLNGGAMLISSDLTTAQLGNFDASGGVITLSGILDNTGRTLGLSGGALALSLTDTLKGGVLGDATGLTLSSATFDGVTLAAPAAITNDTLTTLNGLTFAGTTLTLSETAGTSQIALRNSQTFGGTGHLVLAGTTTTGPSITGAFTLTLGPDMVVTTGSGHAAISPTRLVNQGILSHTVAAKTLTLGGATVANAGLIDVQHGTLAITGSLTNTGTLSATNGGTALINGNLTHAALGLFDATGGTIRINSVLDNTGSTLALTGGGNSLTIAGTLKGGVLSDATGLTLSSAILDGVTLATPLGVIADTLTVQNGLTLSGATLTLTENAAATILSVANSSVISGTGEIVMAGTAAPADSGTVTLTLGNAITVRAQGGSIDTTGLINNGLIVAEGSARTLTLGSSAFLNAGLLKAVNGSFLRINSVTTAGLGNFDASGGTFLVNTLLDNSGATLSLAGGSQALTVEGSLKGGVIIDTTGLTLSTATFDAVTLADDLTVVNQTLTLQNGLTLSNAALHLQESVSASLTLDSSQTIGGTGAVVFDGTSSSGASLTGAYTATIGPGITVRTGTGNGVLSATGLVNQGIVSAAAPATTLTISSASVTNAGTFEARNGGVLVLTNPLLTVGGTFQAVDGGTLRFLGGNLAITSPITLAGNSTASFGATNTSALAISGSGSVIVDASRALTSDGVNVSSWNINGSHTLRFSATNSGTSAPGTLTIAKSGSTYTGRLNLTNAKLIIATDGPTDKAGKIATFYTAITAGSAGGSWTGPGINSSTAAANAAHLAVNLYDNAALHLTSFGGLPVNDDSLLITVTPVADATLDGKVDAFDLNVLASHWQQPSGATVATGDFTRDGKVDAFDLNLLAGNWQYGVSGAFASFSEALAVAMPGGLNVPEPMTLCVLGIPWLALWGRRRTHRRGRC
jgi:filamentous hemagglutinin